MIRTRLPHRSTPRRLRRALALSALVALLAPAPGTGAMAPPPKIRFAHLSIEHGLSQGTVNAILQDSVGFMWFGTQDGLNRYDGYDFVVYQHDPSDPSSLPSDLVLALAEDPSGDLWVGTQGGGLSRWSRATDSFTHYPHRPDDPESLSGNNVRAIHRDRTGKLWIATFESGLNLFDPETGTFERFRHDPDDPSSLGDDHLRALFEDRIGNLWIGTMDGLNLYHRGTRTFRRYRPDPDSTADPRVRSILEDRDGVLWIGTYRGLNRFDRASGRFRPFGDERGDGARLAEERIRVLYEDPEGRLWIGTDGGLYLLREPAAPALRITSHPADPASLSNDRIAAIYRDRGGLMWIGTQGGGVDRWHPRTWAFGHYNSDPRSPGASRHAVLAFAEDDAGALWIGTLGGGLNRFDRRTGEVRHFEHRDGDPATLSSDQVTALLFDRRQTLWVGTMADGLNRYDPARGGFERFRHRPSDPGSLSDDAVMTLFEDRQGALWVGTYGGGLNRYDRRSGTFERYRHDPADRMSLRNDRITSMAEDPDGRLWIGTFAGGLELFDRSTGTFRHFERATETPGAGNAIPVLALHVDPAGDLWVGTQGRGLDRLARLDGERAIFANYNTGHGLPNNVVYGIRSEPGGALWLSTHNGLSRFDPQTGRFTNYDASDGLQSNDFDFGSHYRSPSGELFFGGPNGWNAFYPERIEPETAAPPIVLTSFLKFNQPVDLEQPAHEVRRVSLDHSDYVLSFEFAALDYTAPEKNRYAYRLEGLDQEWIDLGTFRRVTFTNLEPGSYTLRVRGARADGSWNESGLELGIDIVPPWWRSVWAYGLYALVLTVAGWSAATAHRKRSLRRKVLRRARETADAAEAASRAKGEFLAKMSHEIRTPMSGVIGMTELLLETPLDAKQQRYLETIRGSSETLLNILNDILDLSKIEARMFKLEHAPFDLRSCVEDALELLAPLAAAKGLELVYRFEEGTPESIIGDATRLRQILVNLISNAVKFTDEGKVAVTVRARPADAERDEAEIEFTVEDSGVGISAELRDKLFQPFSQLEGSGTRTQHGTGLGLAICKQLSELMGGRIWVDSEPGRGSAFRFTIRSEAAAGPDRSYLYRPDPGLAGRRLLMVGTTASLELLGDLARSWGMEIEELVSHDAAIERLRGAGRRDVAVIDRQAFDRAATTQAAEIAAARGAAVVCLDYPAGHAQHGPCAPASFELGKPLKPARAFKLLLEVASGTTVRPKTKTPAIAEPQPVEPERMLRILLVEDNPVNQEVALRMLEHLGYRADAAGDGIEALEALERRVYDVLLLDLQMPRLDGFGTARRIREDLPRDRRPALIAITAHAMQGDRERCLEAGMDDYLSKPIQIEQLRSALRKVRPLADAEPPLTAAGGRL